MTDSIAVAVELEHQGIDLASRIGGFQVVDQPTFLQGVEMRRTVKAYLGKVAEVFDPIIKAAHAAHKTAVEQKKRLEAPAVEAERLLNQTLVAYEQEQAHLRREAEAAAQRECKRKEAEARAQAAAEVKRLQEFAEEERLQHALEAEARGDAVMAERLLEEPLPVVEAPPVVVFMPPPAVDVPKADGLSFRDAWRAEVEDLALLVKAVAAGEAPLTVILPNQPALNQMARALKGALALAGVRAVCERVPVGK